MKNYCKLYFLFLLQVLLFYVTYCCPPNCLFCLKENKCLTCQQEYFLTVNSQCVIRSVENCQVYAENGKCSICAPTFIIDNKNNKCVKDFSACLKRDFKSLCLECGFGRVLNQKGQCLGVINCANPQRNCNSCKNGYKLTENKCVYSGEECKIIHESGLCQQCKDGFILNGFQCVSKASNSIQNGNINLVQKCSLYSRNEKACLSCQNGYKLFNNLCKSEAEIYQEIIKLADNSIRQSSNGVYVDSNSQFIAYSKILYSQNFQKKDDFLDTTQRQISSLTFQGIGNSPSSSTDNCLIRDSTTLGCKSCIDGFYFFNGLCKQKSVLCSKFNQDLNKCEKCGNNFVLINGECLDAGCEEYLYSQCAKCKSGFIINEEGYCYDPLCESKIDGKCSKCKAGFQFDQASQLCHKIIQGCKLYNQQKTICQSCNEGYQISSNGLCTKAPDDRCSVYSKSNLNQCQRCRDQFTLLKGSCFDRYCKVFESPKNCKLCQQGYILHPNKFYCYDQNCVLYSNGACINCANNYKLQQGFCVRIIQGCQSVEVVTQKCIFCAEPYKLIDGMCRSGQQERCSFYLNGQCTQCKPELVLTNGTCADLNCLKETVANKESICSQCKSGYTLNSLGICLDPNCNSYQNGTCIKCVDNFIIGINKLCIKNPNNDKKNQTQPSNGTDKNDTNKDKSIYCKEFSKESPTVCIKCIDGRYFIRNSQCQPVSENCKGFDVKSGNCTSCENGYATNTEKSTYQDCFKKIQITDPNCLRKNINLFCIKCRPQFYIKDGFCYQADTQCKTFDLFGGDCLNCYQGFTLQNTKCIPLSEQSKCKKYDFQNVCIECQKGYFVATGGVCMQVMPICVTYEMIGGACLTCTSGYLPFNGVCVKIRDPTPNCIKVDQMGNCVECANRFFLDLTTMTCKEVNKFCNEYEMVNGVCKSCNSGFKLRTDFGICVAQSSDDLCSQFDKSTGLCTKCTAEYNLALSTLKCKKQITLCSFYNQQTGECEKCQQTYVLAFKQCAQKTKRDTLDPNCLLGDTFNYCIKCKPEFFISIGYCLKANTLCKTFNVNTGACESCYEGFIVQNEICVDSNNRIGPIIKPDENCQMRSGSLCIKCKNRHFLSYESQMPTCKKVSDLCLTYNQINGLCLTCITGYNLSTSGNCTSTSQQPKYIDIPQIFCQQFDTIAKICNRCYTNYYYSIPDSTCKPLNLSCKTQEPITKFCTSCYLGCILNATKCIPASLSIKLPEDRLGYSTVALLENDPNCVAISDLKCIQCQGGFFVDNSTNKCNVQHQWCDSYEMIGGKCNKCKLGSIIQNGICVKPLFGIDPFCSRYDGAFCVACIEGYKLDNYVCKKA